jgi:uncharacterized membrane protein YjgN (DUF898 family)
LVAIIQNQDLPLQLLQKNPNYNPKLKIALKADGLRLLAVMIINFIFIILTLGLYYPWAKANVRYYLWNETEMNQSRFVFHGKGIEMFKGFLLAYGIIFALNLGIFFSSSSQYSIYFVIAFYLAVLILTPMAMFGAWRYRVARTTWRGIYFDFTGKFREFLSIFYVQIFLTVITLGVYYPWLRAKIQTYLMSHTKFGQYRFSFVGSGGDLFLIYLLLLVLTPFTFGLYYPYFYYQRLKFNINNMVIENEFGEKARPRTTVKVSRVYYVLLTNVLLILFTLGLAYPVARVRSMKLTLDYLDIPVNIDSNHIRQEAEDYRDARGDSVIEILDFGIDF